jgi:hypothetical protein
MIRRAAAHAPARKPAAAAGSFSGLRVVEEKDHKLWGLIVSLAMERLGQR